MTDFDDATYQASVSCIRQRSLELDAQMHELALTDFDAFRARFKDLVSYEKRAQDSKLLGTKVVDIARMLRVTSASLEELGVIPDADSLRFTKNRFEKWERPEHISEWFLLHGDLRFTSEEEGLDIFRPMARALRHHPIKDRLDLMRTVFTRSWRVRAIELEPEFFLGRLGPEEAPRLEPGTHHDNVIPANAIQLLAHDIVQDREGLYEATKSTLQALLNAGVTDSPNPMDGRNCLHSISWGPPTSMVRAFVEAFPALLEERKHNGQVALHIAAASSRPEIVRILLDAGANPRPEDDSGHTPMHYAISFFQRENIQILIDTGAYTDADVDGACAWVADLSIVDVVRGYHQAAKAGRVIKTTGLAAEMPPRPL